MAGDGRVRKSLENPPGDCFLWEGLGDILFITVKGNVTVRTHPHHLEGHTEGSIGCPQKPGLTAGNAILESDSPQ